MNAPSRNNGPLLTRRALVEHINGKLGIPLKKSSFDKLAMKGETPRPDGYYGKVELYRPETGEKWALEKLISARPATLGVK
jgi:hypothetical protein